MGILHFLSIFLILAMKFSVSPALSYCHRESFQHPQKREEKETEAEREGGGGKGEKKGEREISEWHGLFYSRNRAEILLAEALLSASDPQ